MNFLVDAQLPRVLCKVFAARGHHAIHTLDLPEKNLTRDRTINQLSIDERFIVVSKDMDFFYSHLSSGRPWKLILIKTGNIGPPELCNLFEQHWPILESSLEMHTLVQIDRTRVTPVM